MVWRQEEMRICSEKSIKGLSHSPAGTRSGEEQSLSPASLWPGRDTTLRAPEESHTPYCGSGRSLWTSQRTRQEQLPVAPQPGGLHCTPPESLAQAAAVFLPRSGWRGSQSAQAGGHLPKTCAPHPTHRRSPSLTSLPSPKTESSWQGPRCVRPWVVRGPEQRL